MAKKQVRVEFEIDRVCIRCRGALLKFSAGIKAPVEIYVCAFCPADILILPDNFPKKFPANEKELHSWFT